MKKIWISVSAVLLGAAAAFAGMGGGGLSAQNFTGSPASDAVTFAATSSAAQTTGGGPSAVPVGFKGSSNVTGGAFNHAVGLIGWQNPTASSVAGDYRGAEGRVDNQKAASNGMGVLGLTYLDAADCAGMTDYALVGNAEVGSSYGSHGTNVGLWAYARGAAANYNAIFGEGTRAGDNAGVLFRGYITDGAGAASVSMSVNDAYDRFYADLGDAKIDGWVFKLRDSAGASDVRVVDGGYSTVFTVDSGGSVTAASLSPGGYVKADTAGKLAVVPSPVTFVTTAQVLNLSGQGSVDWTALDLSAYVPEGATAAILMLGVRHGVLRVRACGNTGETVGAAVLEQDQACDALGSCICPVDSTRKIEYKGTNISAFDSAYAVYVCGYVK